MNRKPKTKPKKITEGAYGCIYKPAITETGKIEEQYINKIQIAKPVTESEPRLGSIIKTIPNYRRYFAPSEQVSSLVVAAIDEKEMKKCEVVSKEKNKKVVVSKIPYVGKSTLGEQIESIRESLPSRTLSTMKSFHNHLNKAINLLTDDKIGIVHNDIKQNNIVYSESIQCPVLIDFGLSYCVHELETVEDINNAFQVYYEKYPPSHIEVTCIGRIVSDPKWHTKQVDIEDIKETIHTIFTENPVYEIIEKYIGKEEMKKEEKKRIKKMEQIFSQTKNGKKFVDELLENWDTWDLYSINVMMLKQCEVGIPIPTASPVTEGGKTKDPYMKELMEYRMQLIKDILKGDTSP